MGFDIPTPNESDEDVGSGSGSASGQLLNASDGSPATAYISVDDTDDPADLPGGVEDGSWWLNLADLGSPDAANVTFDDSGLVVITGVGDVEAALALVDAALVSQSTAPAMELIDEELLGADAAAITFSAIPATFKDLVVVGELRGTEAAAYVATLNIRVGHTTVDTGANYRWNQTRHDAAARNDAQSSGGTATAVVLAAAIPGASGDANTFGMVDIDLRRYATTGRWRNMQIRTEAMAAENNPQQTIAMGTWENTADTVDCISVFPGAGNWLAGSHLSLYGRR